MKKGLTQQNVIAGYTNQQGNQIPNSNSNMNINNSNNNNSNSVIAHSTVLFTTSTNGQTNKSKMFVTTKGRKVFEIIKEGITNSTNSLSIVGKMNYNEMQPKYQQYQPNPQTINPIMDNHIDGISHNSIINQHIPIQHNNLMREVNENNIVEQSIENIQEEYQEEGIEEDKGEEDCLAYHDWENSFK